jgi:hypothetical protein
LTFSRLLIAELPFMVNVPTGVYPVLIDDQLFPLEVLQEHCAMSTGPQRFALLPVTKVPTDRLGSVVELRTLIQHENVQAVASEDVPPPTDDDLISALASKKVTSGAALTGQELLAQAAIELQGLSPGDRAPLADEVGRRLHARRLFPIETHEQFVAATNTFVRHYMVEFDDPFAEEIVLHHLASTWTRGILQALRCDGSMLESTHYAGKIPPIMRRPWVNHPTERVDRMRDALATGRPVDPILLLAIRAHALLERGATRSAVIEASAALESAVARELKGLLIASGLTEQAAAARLNQTQRFSERCKSLMREVTGRSLAEVDAGLWERVVKHRDNYRHKVTHDDSEPSRSAAAAAVNDFVALARLARQFHIDPNAD